MKKYACIAAAALLLSACGNQSTTGTDAKSDTGSTANTETKKDDAPHAMPDSATMMKNWMAYSTPGKPHEMMASWDGTWESEMTAWHSPDAPPEVTKGSCVNKMAMGGRYQIGTFTGTTMGMPFEGMSTLAYDNAKKMFVSSWIDNMGTGQMRLEGPWDEATKSMTLTGKCVDPGMGDGKEMTMKEVFTAVDADHQTMVMYGPGPDGKEQKMMEIKFTRKK